MKITTVEDLLDLGMTYSEMEEVTGVGRATLHHYLHGGDIKLSSYLKIATYVNQTWLQNETR